MKIKLLYLCVSLQSEELCGDEGGEERSALHRDGPGWDQTAAMCENLISLTFKCLGIFNFLWFFCLFLFLSLSFLPSFLLSSLSLPFFLPFPSFCLLISLPFLLSYLLTSPPHTLHLPHCVCFPVNKIHRSFILHGGCRGQSSLNQFFSIFISDIHLLCPLSFLNSLFLMPARLLSFSTFFILLPSSHSPCLLFHQPFLSFPVLFFL